MEKQRIALVTGGNRGIGLSIVEGLAEKGIKVLLACRDVKSGAQVAGNIAGDIHTVALDLTTPESRQHGMEEISRQFPLIDILVNNAGVLDHSVFGALSYDSLMASMEVNALAAFELTRHFADRMCTQGYGRVVNLSSGWGAFSEGLDGPAAYAISKATLNAITKVSADAYQGNIKINAMCPGWVRTDMGGASATRSPKEGADTAIWLATLDDNGPTGQFFRDKSPIDW